MFKDPEAQWSSKFADEEGQPNLSGLKIPEVDRLIEAQKGEFDVAKRNQIVKKIDTIVYKEYPYVLLWHLNCSRLLYWQKFGMPSYPLGKYGDETAALDYWWIDEKKTTELENADKNNGSLSAIEKEIRWKE